MKPEGTFEEFLNKGWSDHAVDSGKVAARLPEASLLLKEPQQVQLLCNLAVHVFGEHLAQWQHGIEYFDSLNSAESFRQIRAQDQTVEMAIIRNKEVLKFCSDPSYQIDQTLPASEQVRIRAVAASALAQHSEIARASRSFQEAITWISKVADSTPADPAHRALAVTGNNLAASFEEKAVRTPAENDLMILAALTARKEWEIAGGWQQVYWAEYRLVKSCLAAQRLPMAFEHFELAKAVLKVNSSTPLEDFYISEMLILLELASGKVDEAKAEFKTLEKTLATISNDGDRDWCKGVAEKVALAIQQAHN